MDSEMIGILLSDSMHYTIVVSLEMSDEPIFFILMFYFLNHKTTILNIDILHFPTAVGTERLFIVCEASVFYFISARWHKKSIPERMLVGHLGLETC